MNTKTQTNANGGSTSTATAMLDQCSTFVFLVQPSEGECAVLTEKLKLSEAEYSLLNAQELNQ